MTVTVQYDEGCAILSKYGPQGQPFFREHLTPDAAESLAIDLLKAAREARRVSRYDTAPCDVDVDH